MKQTELIAVGLAGLAVYLIWQSQKKKTGTTSGAAARPAGWVSEVLDAGGQRFTNSWRYFDNGVAIDPAGNYYQGGQMVWQAPGAGA